MVRTAVGQPSDFDNHDFLFYVGAGDGFGGSGAETYVFGDPSGSLIAQNYPSSSTSDMNISGGRMTPEQWHQVGLARDGSSMSLYLDGNLLGADPSVSLNSFDDSSNSVIVFGAAKWMRSASMRTRVLDGMVDQIEIYDTSLAPTEIANRYEAFAGPNINPVPEPSSMTLLLTGPLTACAFRTALAYRQKGCREVQPHRIGQL